MLVLQIRPGGKVYFHIDTAALLQLLANGEELDGELTVLSVARNNVSLGFEMPEACDIYRESVWNAIQRGRGKERAG